MDGVPTIEPLPELKDREQSAFRVRTKFMG